MPALDDEDDGPFEAVLWKRSRHFRVWRKRQAVLHSSGWLCLYRAPHKGRPAALRASLALSPECRLERMPDMHRVLYTFLLRGPGMRCYLGTATEAETQRWIGRIGAYCRLEQAPSSPIGRAVDWFGPRPLGPAPHFKRKQHLV